MPYFFVDSYQDGKPAPALYVRAENADAALARAAQLGVEGTGVRQAQDLSGDGQNKWAQSPKEFYLQLLMMPVILLIYGWSAIAIAGSRPAERFDIMMLALGQFMLAGPIGNLYRMVCREKELREQLESEVRELKQRIDSQQGPPGGSGLPRDLDT